MKTPYTMRIAFILVTIVGLIVAGVSIALAAESPNTLPMHRGHGFRAHMSEQGAGIPELIRRVRATLQRDHILETATSELGLSVPALQAARQNGTLRDLFAEHDVTRQSWRDTVHNTVAQLLEEAVADGTLTPDEANAVTVWQRERQGWRHDHGYHGVRDSTERQRLKAVLNPDALWEQVALTLDIAVDDLKAARANGTLHDLLAAHEITHQTWRASVQSARDRLIADAVATGTLTQDEADSLTETSQGSHRHKRHHGFRFPRRP